ncbi:hypothetical protein [Rhizobium lentis]|uniref:hypothetical protein n=1 Tax=Rhizobium lentis TaxID=1138194 RepID=UPI001C83A1D8|nr:hypothetical protein [Rhizobium lentis]MBX4955577.1 hypothetical protein [Rhizobium lentis]MBX4984886.1 hypothetical protein [Rhizobium lentis]MBX5003331.1 hypothetical protein [Rhizobium lentis]MBX5029368.1 hypothetical protein [Rhizobium lentis]MBX5035363.1 hypothetical protein [Rhizobium lentis]
MDDLNKARIVLDSLKQLREEVGLAEEDRMLRLTPALRRLLVEDDLIWAWKRLVFDRKQPEIVADKIAAVTPSNDDIVHLGGGIWNGGAVQSLVMRRGRGPLINVQLAQPQKLNEFLDSAAIVADGMRIKRVDVVKYAANKLGGVHFDPKRDPKKERAYMVLDALAVTTLAGMKAINYHLFSISQQVVSSPDIQELFGRLQKMG